MTTQENSLAPDRSLESRPGVPRKKKAEPMGHAHWWRPQRQTGGEGLLRDVQRKEPTATFSEAQPPRGLSGALRRKAYQVPDYRARRWLMLIFADRVDPIEHPMWSASPRRRATWPALGLLGRGALWRRRRRRARRSRAPDTQRETQPG